MGDLDKQAVFTEVVTKLRNAVERKLGKKVLFLRKSQYPQKASVVNALSFYSQNGPVVVIDEFLPQEKFENICFHELSHFYWADVLNSGIEGRIGVKKTGDSALNRNLFDLKNGLMDHFVDASTDEFASIELKKRREIANVEIINKFCEIMTHYKQKGISYHELYSGYGGFERAGVRRMKEALVINSLFFLTCPYISSENSSKILDVVTESLGEELTSRLNILVEKIRFMVKQSKKRNFSVKFYEEALIASAALLGYGSYFVLTKKI